MKMSYNMHSDPITIKLSMRVKDDFEKVFPISALGFTKSNSQNCHIVKIKASGMS